MMLVALVSERSRDAKLLLLITFGVDPQLLWYTIYDKREHVRNIMDSNFVWALCTARHSAFSIYDASAVLFLVLFSFFFHLTPLVRFVFRSSLICSRKVFHRNTTAVAAAATDDDIVKMVVRARCAANDCVKCLRTTYRLCAVHLSYVLSTSYRVRIVPCSCARVCMCARYRWALLMFDEFSGYSRSDYYLFVDGGCCCHWHARILSISLPITVYLNHSLRLHR